MAKGSYSWSKGSAYNGVTFGVTMPSDENGNQDVQVYAGSVDSFTVIATSVVTKVYLNNITILHISVEDIDKWDSMTSITDVYGSFLSNILT
jgi:hypothetical protein